MNAGQKPGRARGERKYGDSISDLCALRNR